jgi:hypothetical protein
VCVCVGFGDNKFFTIPKFFSRRRKKNPYMYVDPLKCGKLAGCVSVGIS